MDWISFAIGSGIASITHMTIDWIMEAKRQKKEKDREQSLKMKLVVDRIDQHAGRIEQLEKKRR